MVEQDCDCATIEHLPLPIDSKSVGAVSVRIDCAGMILPAERSFVFHANPPVPSLQASVRFVAE